MGRKHCGKRRNCLLQAISSFSNGAFQRLVLQTHENLGLFGKGLSVWYTKQQILCFNDCTSKSFNPFPKQGLVLRVCSISLLKTLWEKEKLLITRISPFPTMFSTHFENFLPFSSNLKLSSPNFFSLEASEICHLGNGSQKCLEKKQMMVNSIISFSYKVLQPNIQIPSF